MSRWKIVLAGFALAAAGFIAFLSTGSPPPAQSRPRLDVGSRGQAKITCSIPRGEPRGECSQAWMRLVEGLG